MVVMAARPCTGSIALGRRAGDRALRIRNHHASSAKHQQKSDKPRHLRITVARSRRLLLLRPNANLKDYEFGRVNGSNAHDDHQPSVVDIILRHRGGVADHEERLVLLFAL